MFYLGVDPGLSGAFALMQEHEIILLHKFDKLEFMTMVHALKDEEVRAVIEKVHAMPKQGSVSMFNFGQNYGWLKGVLDMGGIPYEEVPPQKWKKEFGLNSDKQKSIDVARQLFPKVQLIPPRCRVPDNNLAEAVLLSEYARRKL